MTNWYKKTTRRIIKKGDPNSLLRSRHDVDVLHEDGPRLGTDPGHGDLELDVSHEPGADVHAPVQEPEGVPPQGDIVQLHLPGEKGDAQLVRVQVLQVLAQIIVQEPGGQALQHSEAILSQRQSIPNNVTPILRR